MGIKWDPALRTGVGQVDDEHQELFRQADAILEAMKSGRGREELGKLINFVGQYVHKHFAAEEQLMARYQCPLAEANKQAHRQFVAKFNELKAKFDQHGASPTVALEISATLTSWLTQHIRAIDAKLGDAVKAQQNSAPAGAK